MGRGKSLTVSVPVELRRDLEQAAAATGMTLAAYAGRLLETAQAARCFDERAEGGRAVAGALLLSGSGFDGAAIAATLGVAPDIVDRILDAWRARPECPA